MRSKRTTDLPRYRIHVVQLELEHGGGNRITDGEKKPLHKSFNLWRIRGGHGLHGMGLPFPVCGKTTPS